MFCAGRKGSTHSLIQILAVLPPFASSSLRQAVATLRYSNNDSGRPEHARRHNSVLYRAGGELW